MKLHPEMLRAANGLAQARDITLGQMIRDLLSAEIRRDRTTRPPVRADERLIAPLRARLAYDLADATGWADLNTRLQAKGYVLRAAGGGLALHRWPDDTRICKASELGFSYARLMRRFRDPFPGHTHTWLAERMLNTTKKDAPEDAPDFEVIE